MTVSTLISKKQHTGNGAATVFAYNFKILTDADLVVKVKNLTTLVVTTLTITTHYTVSGAGVATGGNVTLEDLTSLLGVAILSSNFELTIYRVLTLEQDTDLSSQGGFSEETHENVFDKLLMIAQQQQEELDRSVKVDVTSDTDPDDYLTDVAASVAAAAASAAAASASETNAETAETNAETAETNAAASAATIDLPTAAGSPKFANNYALSAVMAANALTVTLLGGDGNALAADNVAVFGFRHPTITTGRYELVSQNAPLTVVLSSGSTLGHLATELEEIYVYLINDGGTLKLALSGTYFDDESIMYSSTAEGGAGAADGRGTLYSTAAATAKSIRLIGVLQSTQATAGTWVTAISNIECTTKAKPAILQYTGTQATIASGSSTNAEYATHVKTRGGIWIDLSNADRIMVGAAGIYKITAHLAATIAGGDFDTGEYAKQDITIASPAQGGTLGYFMMQSSPTTHTFQITGSLERNIDAGSYFTNAIYQNSGVNMLPIAGTWSRIEVRKVG